MEAIFLDSIRKRFAEYKTLGDNTLAQLSETDLHFKPAPESNSIAIIIQHLHGNMLSRWTGFLTADGEKPWRQRDAEFEENAASKDDLLQLWNEGWQTVLNTLHSLQPQDMHRTITIRSEPLSVPDALIRQIGHYASHVGQIIYIGKSLKGSGWRTLSIPRGGSATFLQQMQEQNKTRP